MRRREFITLIGGAAAACPLGVRAQQGERMRRMGVFTGVGEDDLDTQARHAALLQGLAQLGWADGHNLQIDFRWGGGDAERIRKSATELAALAPDLIFATGSAAVGAMLRVTRTVPIVFAIVPDPVGSGFVNSLSRPGGDATGFLQFEYSLSGKWLELLKQIAPGLTRAAILWDPAITAGIGQFAVIQSVAPSLGVDVSPIDLRDAGEIERAVATFAQSSNGGLILTASALSVVHRNLITALALRHKLPAVYVNRSFVTDGGLISYGANFIDQYRQAAGYVDSQGSEASRPAGADADEVRIGDQPQDRQGARPRRATDAARPRRRGDRVGCNNLLRCICRRLAPRDALL